MLGNAFFLNIGNYYRIFLKMKFDDFFNYKSYPGKPKMLPTSIMSP